MHVLLLTQFLFVCPSEMLVRWWDRAQCAYIRIANTFSLSYWFVWSDRFVWGGKTMPQGEVSVLLAALVSSFMSPPVRKSINVLCPKVSGISLLRICWHCQGLRRLYSWQFRQSLWESCTYREAWIYTGEAIYKGGQG